MQIDVGNVSDCKVWCVHGCVGLKFSFWLHFPGSIFTLFWMGLITQYFLQCNWRDPRVLMHLETEE